MSKTTKKSATSRKAKPDAGAKPTSGGSLKDFCRALPGTTEDIKWGDDHVFSVGKKMYAGFDVDSEEEFGFKCDPEDQMRLIQIKGIIPAPYAARFGWVLVEDTRALSASAAKRLLEKAHRLVLAGLPKRVQAEIAARRA